MQSCLDVVEFLADKEAADLSWLTVVDSKDEKVEDGSPLFLLALVNTVNYNKRLWNRLEDRPKELNTVLWRG
jgi:hypothetical protein